MKPDLRANWVTRLTPNRVGLEFRQDLGNIAPKAAMVKGSAQPTLTAFFGPCNADDDEIEMDQGKSKIQRLANHFSATPTTMFKVGAAIHAAGRHQGLMSTKPASDLTCASSAQENIGLKLQSFASECACAFAKPAGTGAPTPTALSSGDSANGEANHVAEPLNSLLARLPVPGGVAART